MEITAGKLNDKQKHTNLNLYNIIIIFSNFTKLIDGQHG